MQAKASQDLLEGIWAGVQEIPAVFIMANVLETEVLRD